MGPMSAKGPMSADRGSAPTQAASGLGQARSVFRGPKSASDMGYGSDYDSGGGPMFEHNQPNQNAFDNASPNAAFMRDDFQPGPPMAAPPNSMAAIGQMGMPSAFPGQNPYAGRMDLPQQTPDWLRQARMAWGG